MRQALKKLKSVEYYNLDKIESYTWDRLVAKPWNKYYTSGDLLTFMIKQYELFGDQIAYISPYDLQLLICHQNKLTNGELSKLNLEQYSNIVKKWIQKLSYSPTIKIKNIGESTS